MKKKRNKSVATSALQIALPLALILTLTTLFASTFRAAQLAGSRSGSDGEEFMVRMPSQLALPGPVGFGGSESSASVPRSLIPSVNALINNDNGVFNCNGFTQSETSVVAFGSAIVVGFNDSGSYVNGGNTTNHFTGWSRSTDGGVTWSDGGALPDSTAGDAGDPVLARDSTSGVIYFSTLGFTSINVIQVFRSTDDGATWMAPVNGAPGKIDMQDKEWITVDDFSGSGNGNVYLVERDFGDGNGIYLFRSTDAGNTWGPNGGTLIASASGSNVQGAFVTVSPDHSVQVFWYNGGTLSGIKVSKSTDQGVTFGSAVAVVTFVSPGGPGGDLGLIGTLNGGERRGFRTNRFPHVAVNPVSGNIYCTYNDKITSGSSDKADIFFVQSTDGGANWSARTQVNDDQTTTDQWFPNVVVSPAGDQLGIFYYSRQDDTANDNLFKYYGRLGSISGATVTFRPSGAVSDTQSFPEFARDDVIFPTYTGDYDQAYATPGVFHVTWADNRNNLTGCTPKKDPNVFYQSISTAPPTLTPRPTPTPRPRPTPVPRP